MASNSTIPVQQEHSFYGYVPTGWVCIVFLVLFAISALLHLGQAIKFRTWWMIPTMFLGCVGEVVGWYGRYWSSNSPNLLDPFLMQIVCTIISPSFMSAANFTILGLIINRLGPQYSWLSPRWYLIVFIGFDLAALVIQSVGGAQASSAARRGTNANTGGQIMLYGIVVQMIALSIYVLLGADFVVRHHLNRPARKVTRPTDSSSETIDEKNNGAVAPIEKNVRIMLIGLIINATFFFVRTIYRTIELNAGWDGPIITNQLLFNLLDGMQITLCTYTFNIIHPGFFLRKQATSIVPA